MKKRDLTESMPTRTYLCSASAAVGVGGWGLVPRRYVGVTRKMIDAGSEELMAYDNEYDSPEEYVVKIYRKMEKAKKK